jgi:hypothetical protein
MQQETNKKKVRPNRMSQCEPVAAAQNRGRAGLGAVQTKEQEQSED